MGSALFRYKNNWSLSRQESPILTDNVHNVRKIDAPQLITDDASVLARVRRDHVLHKEIVMLDLIIAQLSLWYLAILQPRYIRRWIPSSFTSEGYGVPSRLHNCLRHLFRVVEVRRDQLRIVVIVVCLCVVIVVATVCSRPTCEFGKWEALPFAYLTCCLRLGLLPGMETPASWRPRSAET